MTIDRTDPWGLVSISERSFISKEREGEMVPRGACPERGDSVDGRAPVARRDSFSHTDRRDGKADGEFRQA